MRKTFIFSVLFFLGLLAFAGAVGQAPAVDDPHTMVLFMQLIILNNSLKGGSR